MRHALRAFTPDDATALAKAVRTYPRTEDYDLDFDLARLGTGEAVITVLSESGAPTPVAWTRLHAPRSLMAQIEPSAQQHLVASSPLQAKYGQAIDRESAYERLAAKLAPPPTPDQPEQHPAEPRRAGKEAAAAGGVIAGVLASSAFKSFARSAASALGREITRGIFGTRKRR